MKNKKAFLIIIVILLLLASVSLYMILTKEAFENAIIVHSAIGGSTNATIHLPAIASELGIVLEPELFDKINHEIPHIGNINPSGAHLTESFFFAGGIPYVQYLLKDKLHLDVMTVTGKTLGENLDELEQSGYFERYLGYLANYGLKRDDVIFPTEKAQEIGTFETSILPYEDCCTVFLPKHPTTKPKLERILESESKLDVEALVEAAVKSQEIVNIMPE